MRPQFKSTIGARGVNFQVDPTQLEDEELAYCKNALPVKVGTLETRPAMAHARTLDGQITSVQTNSIIDFIFSSCPLAREVVLYKDSSNNYVLCTYREASEAGPTRTTLTNITNVRPHLFNIGKRTFCFNGAESYVIEEDPDAPGTLHVVTYHSKLTQAGAATVKPELCAMSHGRVVLGRLGGAFQSHITFLQTEQDEDQYGEPPFDWLDNQIIYAIGVGLEDQGDLTAMFGAMLAGAADPSQSVLYVWKRDAMYVVTGEAGLRGDAEPLGNVAVAKVQARCGCVSQATVVQTPFGVMWCGTDDVWLMPWGGTPIAVGTKLRPWLLNQPNNMQWRYHAAYADGFYRLALYNEGSGPTDNDPCDAVFMLDFRRGVPSNASEAIWYGPQCYVPSGGADGTYCMRVDDRPNGDGKLYGVHSGLAGASSRYFITLVTFDGREAYDTCLPQAVGIPWQSETLYGQGDQIVPGGYGTQGLGGQVWVATVTSGAATGTSGISEPDWSSMAAKVDGDLTWNTLGSPVDYSDFTVEPPQQHSGNDICIDVRTKEWNDPTAALDKLLSGAFLTFDAVPPLRLLHSFGTDFQDNYQLVYAPENMTRQVAVDSFDNTRIGRTWRGVRLEGSASVRARAKSFQVRLQTLGHFVVDARFATGGLLVWNGSGWVQLTFTMPTGVQSSMANFVSNLTTSILAALAASSVPTAYLSIIDGSVKQFTFDDDVTSGAKLRIPYGDGNDTANTLTDAIKTANRWMLNTLGFGPGELRMPSNNSRVFGKQSVRETTPTRMCLSRIDVKYRVFGKMPFSATP